LLRNPQNSHFNVSSSCLDRNLNFEEKRVALRIIYIDKVFRTNIPGTARVPVLCSISLSKAYSKNLIFVASPKVAKARKVADTVNNAESKSGVKVMQSLG
jgi:hypothetical protein